MRHTLTLTSADGTEQHRLSVPVSWADVSLQQFIDWQCSEGPAVEALTGISTEQLHRLAYSDAGYLMNLLAFAAQLPEQHVSPGLQDVGEASYGQMLLATQYLQENPDKPLIWYAPYLYALYRSREVFGRYDDEKIAQMEAAVRAAPVAEVLGNVLFTQAHWILSFSATPPTPTTTPSRRTTKSTPAWRNWVSGFYSLAELSSNTVAA